MGWLRFQRLIKAGSPRLLHQLLGEDGIELMLLLRSLGKVDLELLLLLKLGLRNLHLEAWLLCSMALLLLDHTCSLLLIDRLRAKSRLLKIH